MDSNKRDELIIKLIEDSISDVDIEILNNWLLKEKNRKYFDEFIELNYLINSKNSFNYKVSLQKIKRRIIIPKKSKNNFLKYAAVFIGLIGISYFMINTFLNLNSEKLVNYNEEVTLKLNDGSLIVLSAEGENEIVNHRGELIGHQKENLLVYDGRDLNIRGYKKQPFNELSVPNGKNFQVELSDGTKVYLNAGTRLRYPVNITSGQDRMVFLTGEAYFDVVRDIEHPFKVKTEEIDINVLGTKFNVEAYLEEENINTTVIQGSVGVYNNKNVGAIKGAKSRVLEPGFRAIWNKDVKSFNVGQVQTDNIIAWTSNKLILQNTSFKIISQKLERKYNVTIINNNAELDKALFNVYFDDESIEEVLETFRVSFDLNYEISINKVVIN